VNGFLRGACAPLLGAAAVLLAAAGSDPVRDTRLPSAPKFAVPRAGALFAEDFSDGLRAWTPDQPGVWSIRQGSLRADLPDGRQLRSFIYAGSVSWTDYALDVDVLGMRGVDKGAVVRVEDESGIGIDLRGPGYHDLVIHRREWPMGRVPVDNANGVWHHLRVEARAGRCRVWVDGALRIEKTDARNLRPRGRIALAAYTGGTGQCTVYYDNVVVTALRHAEAE
jgi:hypothetical protein